MLKSCSYRSTTVCPISNVDLEEQPSCMLAVSFNILVGTKKGNIFVFSLNIDQVFSFIIIKIFPM